MKRNKMITEIYKVLKSWENCKFERRMAKQVLDRIEELGMVPPARWRDRNWIEEGMIYADWIQLPSKVNEWEEND